MFESIQDYLCNEIDKEELIDRISNSLEYLDSKDMVRNKLDMLLEDLKSTKDKDKIVELITDNEYFKILNVYEDSNKLFELATRTCNGPVPYLDPPTLAAFIDVSLENNDDERVFRLVFNYNDMLIDKSKIEDYYINNKNAFYINEMACNNLTDIDLNKLGDALIDIGDLNELKYFVTHVNDDSYNKYKILDKIKELES